jgi:HEAT repeat protein
VTRADSWARTLRDWGCPIDARAAAARALAALATDDAVATLATALDGSAWTLRARIAESLGLADHPRARGLISALLDDPDEEVACAAVRAHAWRPADEAVADLTRLLGDHTRSPARDWLRIVEAGGPEAVARVYLDTLEGRVTPDQGHVLSLLPP